MRKVNAWVLSATLVLALVLIWASATGSIGLSLPWAVVLGLGINVVLLFWEHRQKLHDFFGHAQELGPARLILLRPDCPAMPASAACG